MISHAPRRSLAILVSLALLATPLAASAGPVLHSKYAPVASAPAHHRPASDEAVVPQTGKYCQQHESDGNSCCTVCAQFVNAPSVSIDSPAPGTGRIPFLSQLDGRLPSAPPGPPPRA